MDFFVGRIRRRSGGRGEGGRVVVFRYFGGIRRIGFFSSILVTSGSSSGVGGFAVGGRVFGRLVFRRLVRFRRSARRVFGRRR